VSGFVGSRYELTATKAEYWHRFCGCGAESLVAIYTAHRMEAQGFVRHYHKSPRVLLLSRSDLTATGGADVLYAAVAGIRKWPEPERRVSGVAG
jgi:hypothetical protein